MREGKIFHGKSVLRYYVCGTGARKMLAFHGFGQDHRAFLSFCSALHDYTLYVFDLFLFGQSTWQEDTSTLSSEYLQQVVSRFLQSERIEAFEVAGFSLGARMALRTFCLFPNQVQRIVLIAPDGIRISPWYRFATGSRVGRALFRHAMQNPWILTKALYLWKSFGFIGPWEYAYIGQQLSTAASRRRIYQVWNLYKDLAPATGTIARLAGSTAIPVLIFVGTKDKMIRSMSVRPLLRKIPHAMLIELEARHAAMIRHSAQWLAAMGG